METDSIESNLPLKHQTNSPVLEQGNPGRTESNLIDFFDENTDPALPMNRTESLGCSPCKTEEHPDSPGFSHVHDRPTIWHFQWTKGELIGSGAFGKVYLGFNQDTGHLVAVKQV